MKIDFAFPVSFFHFLLSALLNLYPTVSVR